MKKIAFILVLALLFTGCSNIKGAIEGFRLGLAESGITQEDLDAVVKVASFVATQLVLRNGLESPSAKPDNLTPLWLVEVNGETLPAVCAPDLADRCREIEVQDRIRIVEATQHNCPPEQADIGGVTYTTCLFITKFRSRS